MEYVCASYVLCVTSILDFFFGCEPGAARIAAIVTFFFQVQYHTVCRDVNAVEFA